MRISSKLRSRRIIPVFVLLLAAWIVINLPVSIRQCVDGRCREIKMPLYVKWTQFLARHYEYERLAKEITKGCKTDEEKVLAILKWTRENIKDVPAGMPVYDDHILYIIIRGYAVSEQFQDVFTTLCSYSGVQAFFEKVYDKDRKNRYVLSFVKLYGKWCVFDAYNGVYFRIKNNRIASVEDIINDRSLINGVSIDTTISGAPYKEFYLNLRPVMKPMTLRAEKQMPLKRMRYEAMKVLGIEKAE